MSPSDYFQDSGGVPEEPGRFVDVAADIPVVELIDGLELRPVVGRDLMVSYVNFAPHSVAPVHSHVEEQIICVLEGRLAVTVGDEERILGPGEVAVVPPFVPHGARSLDEPCFEIDVFHPPRQALLDASAPDDPSD